MYVCPECGATFADAGACSADGFELVATGGDPLLGQTVGSYRIARLIGVGGMGKVYKGVQPSIGSRVAVKVLEREAAQDRELVERFFAEARAVNLIRHEGIVNVLDLSMLADGRPCIVMEHLEGAPLSSLIERCGPLPLGSLAHLVGEVLDAIEAAHEKGIVHRDLKPDNVFVSPNGRAKVLDFGIARLTPAQGANAAGPTRTGAILGTPLYMAPEQVLARSVDARTDLYALGVILFEGATGRPPFAAASLYDLLRQQVESPPPAPRVARPDMPPSYEAVILRALAKHPEQRFPSARAFANALKEATQTLPPAEWGPLGTGRRGTAVMASPSAPPPAPSAAPPPHPSASLPSAAAISNATSGSGPRGFGVAAAAILVAALAVGITVVVARGGRTKDAEANLGKAASEPSSESAKGEAREGGNAPSGDETTADEDERAATTPHAGAKKPAIGPAFEPKRFDITAFIPRAEALARMEYEDAVLVRIDAGGVLPDGYADLTLDDALDVTYRFQSPSRAKRKGDEIIGLPKKNHDCVYYVVVSHEGINPYPVRNWACTYVEVGPPKCSVAQVWESAIKLGAPSQKAVASLGYWDDGRGKGRWNVTVGKFSRWVTDSCQR